MSYKFGPDELPQLSGMYSRAVAEKDFEMFLIEQRIKELKFLSKRIKKEKKSAIQRRESFIKDTGYGLPMEELLPEESEAIWPDIFPIFDPITCSYNSSIPKYFRHQRNLKGFFPLERHDWKRLTELDDHKNIDLRQYKVSTDVDDVRLIDPEIIYLTKDEEDALAALHSIDYYFCYAVRDNHTGCLYTMDNIILFQF